MNACPDIKAFPAGYVRFEFRKAFKLERRSRKDVRNRNDIESEGTLGYLRSDGYDQVQGFWGSHPMAPPEFAQRYRKQ